MPTGYPADVDVAQIISLYESGYSCNQIAKEIGYSETVVKRRLDAAGISLRSRSESLRLRFELEPRETLYVENVCPQCKQSYKVKKSRAKRRKFCSISCSSRWNRDHGILAQPLPRPVLICKTCEQPFQVSHPYKAKTQQFCSAACARYFQHMNDRRWANTTIELIIQALLMGMGIHFVTHWRLDGFTADIFLPDERKAIECDGNYWHKLPITVQTDLRKERAFSAENISVLHLTETEIMNDIQSCKDKILHFLDSHGPF